MSKPEITAALGLLPSRMRRAASVILPPDLKQSSFFMLSPPAALAAGKRASTICAAIAMLIRRDLLAVASFVSCVSAHTVAAETRFRSDSNPVSDRYSVILVLASHLPFR
jgi:hypothetical protein